MSAGPPWIIFTDLDGTLLDGETYRWDAAEEALARLRAAHVPVVLCTSKTRAPTERWRTALRLGDPFVVENGGAIYLPANYFPFTVPGARLRNSFQVIELGIPYEKLVGALAEAATATGMVVRGFAQMSDAEVAALSGLEPRAAARARAREYDEAFLLETGEGEKQERFFAWLRQQGLRWVRGGRFWHLMGRNDKGMAVERLVGLYRQRDAAVRTVGLGDSPNDLDFLRVVDRPILVARPDGTYDEEVRRLVPRVKLAPGAGPVGWNAAVVELLEQERL
ncbi:MAG: HAD-IIB family hydrolase [Terriglobia bacterium]